MDYKDIQEEAKKDLTFSITNVEHYALRLGLLKEKYARYLQDYRIKLKQKMLELDVVFSTRHTYYSVSSNRAIDRRDIDTYIKGDKEYCTASAQLAIVEEQVRYIDGVIKSLDNMSFTINSAVKMHIFKNGG